MSERDDQVKTVASNVVESLSAIEESFRLAKLDLLRRENELFKPLYAKREKLTSAIPRFWSTVLSIEDELKDCIQEQEADLLKSCTSLKVEKDTQDPRNFTIAMTFSRNAYLEPDSCSLLKSFTFDKGQLKSRVVKMNWKTDHDLPAQAAEQGRLSFFSLFSFVGSTDREDRADGDGKQNEEDDDDQDDPQLVLEDMAMLLVDEVYPHALSYFTDALLPPDTPLLPPAAETNGTVTPYESMTTSFLDQQEKVANSRNADTAPTTGKSFHLAKSGKEIEQYATKTSLLFPESIQKHRRESIEAFNEVKMITINEAQFLHFLVSQLKCKRVLEIGCFTGYSAMVFANAGAEEVLTCEIDQELASFAKLGVHSAGLSEKVKVLVGDAHKTISDRQTVQGKFDLIFIDAEKEGYTAYLKTILERGLLAKEGTIVADNTLRRGCVATMELPVRQRTIESREEKAKNDDFESGVGAIRAFNDYVHSIAELECVLVPAWDGCTFIKYK